MAPKYATQACGLFELMAIKTQLMQEKLLPFLSLFKGIYIGGLAQRESSE